MTTYEILTKLLHSPLTEGLDLNEEQADGVVLLFCALIASADEDASEEYDEDKVYLGSVYNSDTNKWEDRYRIAKPEGDNE